MINEPEFLKVKLGKLFFLEKMRLLKFYQLEVQEIFIPLNKTIPDTVINYLKNVIKNFRLKFSHLKKAN